MQTLRRLRGIRHWKLRKRRRAAPKGEATHDQPWQGTYDQPWPKTSIQPKDRNERSCSLRMHASTQEQGTKASGWFGLLDICGLNAPTPPVRTCTQGCEKFSKDIEGFRRSEGLRMSPEACRETPACGEKMIERSQQSSVTRPGDACLNPGWVGSGFWCLGRPRRARVVRQTKRGSGTPDQNETAALNAILCLTAPIKPPQTHARHLWVHRKREGGRVHPP